MAEKTKSAEQVESEPRVGGKERESKSGRERQSLNLRARGERERQRRV